MLSLSSLLVHESIYRNLKVSDVVSENGTIKDEVKVKQKKTGKITLSMPLS